MSTSNPARGTRRPVKALDAASHRQLVLSSSFVEPQPPVAERMAAGKALREHLPRERHAELPLNPKRDPVAIVLAEAKTRVPELVPVRHARMLQSPFAFLRGSAAVMAADLALTPDTGLRVQANGDMHVANFGLHASAERKLVFAVNDFDETLPGPWEWDLKRLAASAWVAMRHLGANRRQCQAAARKAVAGYRRTLRACAGMGHLDVWYATLDTKAVMAELCRETGPDMAKAIDKARKRTHQQVLDKMTEGEGASQRILETAPLVVRATHTSTGRRVDEALGLFLDAYLESLAPDRRLLLRRYQVIDVAVKVVGVGSVGTRCWVLFLLGAHGDDPLFLQVKEAGPSVLAPYFPPTLANQSQGRRVVSGQRLIQGSPDIFLGWGTLDGIDFYVRQLRDMKGGVQIEPGKTDPRAFVGYCGLCGRALALAHAKSGDAARISGYVGTSDALDRALSEFAEQYADLTVRDHADLALAARAGRVPVADAAA